MFRGLTRAFTDGMQRNVYAGVNEANMQTMFLIFLEYLLWIVNKYTTYSELQQPTSVNSFQGSVSVSISFAFNITKKATNKKIKQILRDSRLWHSIQALLLTVFLCLGSCAHWTLFRPRQISTIIRQQQWGVSHNQLNSYVSQGKCFFTMLFPAMVKLLSRFAYITISFNTQWIIWQVIRYSKMSIMPFTFAKDYSSLVRLQLWWGSETGPIPCHWTND